MRKKNAGTMPARLPKHTLTLIPGAHLRHRKTNPTIIRLQRLLLQQLPLTLPAIHPIQLLNLRHQLSNAKRFRHNIIHTGGQQRRNLLASCIRRDRDDGHVAPQLALALHVADLACAGQPVHDGHLFVH